MTDLKPCPFCGGEAKYIVKSHSERGIVRGWEFGIHCIKCGATTPKTSYKLEVQLSDDGKINIIKDERCQVIEAWNRRANDETDDVETVRHGHWVVYEDNERECYCSNCEFPAGLDDYGYHNMQDPYCRSCGAKMDGKENDND